MSYNDFNYYLSDAISSSYPFLSFYLIFLSRSNSIYRLVIVIYGSEFISTCGITLPMLLKFVVSPEFVSPPPCSLLSPPSTI